MLDLYKIWNSMAVPDRKELSTSGTSQLEQLTILIGYLRLEDVLDVYMGSIKHAGESSVVAINKFNRYGYHHHKQWTEEVSGENSPHRHKFQSVEDDPVADENPKQKGASEFSTRPMTHFG
ncbi:hypothetical protein HAX54_009677 [Datura stramonium]|uniref:Uncharacterized protein n=1 Tax=Datura stramonium TaxID=4076 RepID=A0ABS8TG36_DATST|nr:hypothetical protein [Datura stramonium]